MIKIGHQIPSVVFRKISHIWLQEQNIIWFTSDKDDWGITCRNKDDENLDRRGLATQQSLK